MTSVDDELISSRGERHPGLFLGPSREGAREEDGLSCVPLAAGACPPGS